MKNISLKRESNADQTGIFFINIKPQFTEIFGENIGNYFENIKILLYTFSHIHLFRKVGNFIIIRSN